MIKKSIHNKQVTITLVLIVIVMYYMRRFAV